MAASASKTKFSARLETTPRKVSSELKQDAATDGTQEGEPLQVVSVKQPHQFSLNISTLSRILHDPRVIDSRVAILSVTGSCRQGKSFLLNFFLKYLKAQGALHWLGDEELPMTKGFPWAVGVDSLTMGIIMWSEPFILRDDKGNQVALLLMDTQGGFNCESTLKESATVFALSVLLSSMQIYNVTSNIHESDLQQLQFFTEYSRLALAEGIAKPFQHLMFLVRDWPYAYQYPYGADGGQALVEKRLRTFDSQHPELRDLREELQRCFSKISCFLLPHPGLTATTTKDFTGQIKDIDGGFKTCLFHLVPFLIGKEKLAVKEFNGSPLTGKEVMEYFVTYFSIFQTDELPSPKSVLQVTSEANHLAATVVAEDHYVKTMDKIFGEQKPHAELKAIQDHHNLVKKESMKIYHSTRKMGGQELSKMYLKNLEKRLDEQLIEFLNRNEMKTTGAVGLTPAVLFVTIFMLYAISGLLTIIYLDFVALYVDFVSYCLMGLLGTWVLVRLTGDHHEVSEFLDHVALALWERVYVPLWTKIIYEEPKYLTNVAAPAVKTDGRESESSVQEQDSKVHPQQQPIQIREKEKSKRSELPQQIKNALLPQLPKSNSQLQLLNNTQQQQVSDKNLQPNSTLQQKQPISAIGSNPKAGNSHDAVAGSHSDPVASVKTSM